MIVVELGYLHNKYRAENLVKIRWIDQNVTIDDYFILSITYVHHQSKSLAALWAARMWLLTAPQYFF